MEPTQAIPIAFLGLGNMGRPMALNLAAAGYQVQAYDPAPAAAAAAADAGVKVVESAAAAATGAAAVITMFQSGRQVLDAYARGAGIVGTLAEGALVIDCSTCDVSEARAAHELAAAAGLAAVDAPVSGGVVGATAGTLTFMVGGTDPAIERAEPILSTMGRRVVRCGAPGAGQAAKVCNNLLLAASMIATGEAFVLGERLGLTPQALYDVVSTSTGQCWAANVNCPVPGPVPQSPANRDFAGGFANALMAKDLRLAAAAAAQTGVAAALTQQAREVYEELAAADPARDFSSVIELIRSRSQEVKP